MILIAAKLPSDSEKPFSRQLVLPNTKQPLKRKSRTFAGGYSPLYDGNPQKTQNALRLKHILTFVSFSHFCILFYPCGIFACACIIQVRRFAAHTSTREIPYTNRLKTNRQKRRWGTAFALTRLRIAVLSRRRALLYFCML